MDRGGTFTDLTAQAPDGTRHALKLLSDSNQYDNAAIEAIRRILDLPPGVTLPAERIASIRLGSTVATNALLERKGAPVGLLITRGFRDLLEIGDQRRPELFALDIRKPENLYCAVAEANERMGPDGAIEQALDPAQIRAALTQLKHDGARAVAIAFLHAWDNPTHEQEAARIAQEFDFDQISLSSETLRVISLTGRGQTTLVDAYLSPVLRDYIDTVRRWTGDIPVHFMSSAGALLPPAGFTGKDAILSGPAGGVLAVAHLRAQLGDEQAIGLDMGGTSTDVCRVGPAGLERTLSAETAGIRYQAPMLRIETVAAGGGSIIDFDGGKLTVGPESAGSSPGPACYGWGGPLAITDANVLLGRVRPQRFPHLFGAHHNGPLDTAASAAGFAALAARVEAATGARHTPQSLALGALRVANETMCQPIRALSVAQGYDLRRHTLVCFGGAGAQHACGVARLLNIPTVRIHPLAGVMSAYGIAMTPHRRHATRSLILPITTKSVQRAQMTVDQMLEQLRADLLADLRHAEPVEPDRIVSAAKAGIRARGADQPLWVAFSAQESVLRQRFVEAHMALYGFHPGEELEFSALEAEVTWRNDAVTESRVATDGGDGAQARTSQSVEPLERAPVWFDGADAPLETPIYARDALPLSSPILGPALISEPNSVIVVEPDFSATRDAQGVVTLHRVDDSGANREDFDPTDPITVALFNHRFMGIAERMGNTLAGAAHSINMRERHDFSCAIFDAHGALIANAPHVPVHLGAMGATVRHLISTKSASLRAGDVYASNDPRCGGSHLPDITVMTPIFPEGAQDARDLKPHLFVATRGHHADIGGTTPGSMPPFAQTLAEEGVVLSNMLIVRGGVFRHEAVLNALASGPYPARNPQERLSDLRSQIAANATGVVELNELCREYGVDRIHACMDAMRHNAMRAMAQALEQVLGDRESWVGERQDAMDDGAIIQARIEIARRFDGLPRAMVDLRGCGPTHSGNLNAPMAVTQAAILYAFRCLIDHPIPLNDGCLALLDIAVDADSLVNPAPQAAVSGGNVETSQRIVDVLLGALGVAAASQGTMNNLLLGDPDGETGQYYETIAGGSGATAQANGASGVQVHMTNTRITDPEILERRFAQLRLTAFRLRTGSGGAGAQRGGEGVERELRFLAPMQVTVVSERRERAPFGLHGGDAGACGENTRIKANGQEETLPGRFVLRFEAGESLRIRTPGGGGYGAD
ncbi:putative 5-oxoprolinase [Magnetofaba australis IT-1]|uniref:Putative 5-oxoprolinase n=1 Tax=Magnetofaba australis IT-1 TaxID=1434232 RepID=A0A1Y2K8L2_9PROT|nr:putative 5-oxoprolinase [Magnetofaba australis IT-1]